MKSSIQFLLLCALASGLFGQASQTPVTKPKVVFVCEHGVAKSVIAAAEFSRVAKQNGLDVEVVARGANPDPEIPASVRDGLKADGLQPLQAQPTKVSKEDLKGATKIVTFGPDLRSLLPSGAAVTDWSATPSVSDNYTAARDYIRKQVETLVKDLKK
jgi:protein-tyrosine-phosphatase